MSRSRLNGLCSTTTYRLIHRERGYERNVEYVGYIVRGLCEHGVAAEYIAKVKSIAKANSPAIEATVNAL